MNEKEVKEFLDEVFKDNIKISYNDKEAYLTKKTFFDMVDWIVKAKKLLNAIKFNVEHPSKNRDVIGGLEIGLIDDLLNENLSTSPSATLN